MLLLLSVFTVLTAMCVVVRIRYANSADVPSSNKLRNKQPNVLVNEIGPC